MAAGNRLFPAGWNRSGRACPPPAGVRGRMWRDSARVPFGGGSGPGEAESEAQDEFVTGFGNLQSGLYHALQAERCHVNSGATEVL